MRLSNLRLTHFKNYESAMISIDQRVNLFYGANGSGKTNLLDAIHVLALSKSYFGMSDRQLVQDGAAFYRIDGSYTFEDKWEQAVIKYQPDRKKEILINTEKVKRVADLIGRYPVVLIAPNDIAIVNGASKERRDYMNRWLCQSSKDYLLSMQQYQRLLRQKDALLKRDVSPPKLAVEALNDQMIRYAILIHHTIQSELVMYQEKVKEYYGAISDFADEIEINHISQLHDVDVAKLYGDAIYDEIRAKRPLVGPQRDDYEYLIDGRVFKKYGSQGQIKTLLYGLRLAEYSCLSERLDRSPIVLLDDVFEKLDKERLSALINTIHDGAYSQVFLSDTEVERSKEIFDDRGITFAAYRVTKGSVERTH